MSRSKALSALQAGDWISHRALMATGQHESREGMVVNLLSAQFVYETEDGRRCFCLHTDDWNLEGEAPWLR